MPNWKNRIVTHGIKPASQFLANPENWRKHPPRQREAIKSILAQIGWVQDVIENRQTGHLIDGHERVWDALENDDADVPYVLVDLSWEEEKAILAFLDPSTYMAETDEDRLRALLKDVVAWNPDLSDLAVEVALDMNLDLSKPDKPKGTPNPRNLPIDVYITCGSIGHTALEDPAITNSVCCLAVRCGLKYGVQSSGSGGVCPGVNFITGHDLGFIDNDFYQYDHELHLAAVRRWNPKYATVRDVMTRQQCNHDGIEYFPLEQILDWADELAEHAQNVIVIPKFDCLDQIPEKYVLGFSVPTSHGGTPLPLEMFKGRRVHLLGGSWKDQLAHMAVLGEDVVSLDNNYILKMAEYGQYLLRDGKEGQVSDIDGSLISPRWVALSISLAVIATDVHHLYSDQETSHVA